MTVPLRRLPGSARKHLRKRKAEIRRETVNPETRTQRIKELYGSITSPRQPKTQGGQKSEMVKKAKK